MNYARVYDEFIADRRSKSQPDGYSEEHHIRPKSMGGNDDPGNLLRLTPEDHYFAHLLLAKAHGGSQWYSVVRMGYSRVDGKRPWVMRRYMYGAARRKMAEELSTSQKGRLGARGAENGMYDETTHLWTNVDTGETALATKGEMWALVGGCRAHWTSAVSGERKTMYGWTTNPESVRIRSSKGKQFTFANDNGCSFTGTQGEFARLFGFSVATASRLARGMQKSNCGWRVYESKAA